jgi:hypothetical protein
VSYKPLALVAAGLCVLALADLPHGYYPFLRIVVCGVAAYGAYLAATDHAGSWTVPLAFLAVVFNPVIPVHLDREAWAPVDLGAALLLAVSAFRVGRPHPGRPPEE